VRSQRLLQFMQMTANPIMTPFVKYDYILRELAASMDLNEDKILNDPREAAIQATLMAKIAALMPPPVPQQQQAAQPAGVQGGSMSPEAATEPPVPQEAGFTGGGGGSPQAAAAVQQAQQQNILPV